MVDLERRLVYVGVANPAPFPGTAEFPNGTSRPGDNLYTNSIVALDLDTGALAWFHQVTPHDIFDRDQVHTLMATLEDGTDVVVSAGKSGVFVGLDPDDGTVLWRTEVGVHDNDDLEALDGPTLVYPGTYGGILTPPSTADGIVYAATVDAATELRARRDRLLRRPARHRGRRGRRPSTPRPARSLWAVDVPGDPLGATTVVERPRVHGAARRHDPGPRPGRRGGGLATFDAGGGVNGWLSVAGDQVFVPVGNSAPPQVLALGLP